MTILNKNHIETTNQTNMNNHIIINKNDCCATNNNLCSNTTKQSEVAGDVKKPISPSLSFIKYNCNDHNNDITTMNQKNSRTNHHNHHHHHHNPICNLLFHKSKSNSDEEEGSNINTKNDSHHNILTAIGSSISRSCHSKNHHTSGTATTNNSTTKNNLRSCMTKSSSNRLLLSRTKSTRSFVSGNTEDSDRKHTTTATSAVTSNIKKNAKATGKQQQKQYHFDVNSSSHSSNDHTNIANNNTNESIASSVQRFKHQQNQIHKSSSLPFMQRVKASRMGDLLHSSCASFLSRSVDSHSTDNNNKSLNASWSNHKTHCKKKQNNTNHHDSHPSLNRNKKSNTNNSDVTDLVEVLCNRSEADMSIHDFIQLQQQSINEKHEQEKRQLRQQHRSSNRNKLSLRRTQSFKISRNTTTTPIRKSFHHTNNLSSNGIATLLKEYDYDEEEDDDDDEEDNDLNKPIFVPPDEIILSSFDDEGWLNTLCVSVAFEGLRMYACCLSTQC